MLDQATVDALMAALDDAWPEEPLPNAPSDPSPDGSQASDIPTPSKPEAIDASPTSTTS
jgi:hypothetical protein